MSGVSGRLDGSSHPADRTPERDGPWGRVETVLHHRVFRFRETLRASRALRTACVLSVLLAVCLSVGCAGSSSRQQSGDSPRRVSDPVTSSPRKDALTSSAQHKELVRNIERLQKELKETRAALEVEKRELNRLREQRTRTELSRGLRADSIEIPFYSPVVKPGGLDLWVVPRDAQDDVVKVPGTLQVRIRRQGLLGLGTTGPTVREWSVQAGKLKDMWEGQLYQGYHVLLDWSEEGRPDLADTLVQVRFTGPAGKTCQTEKPIKSGE